MRDCVGGRTYERGEYERICGRNTECVSESESGSVCCGRIYIGMRVLLRVCVCE